MIDDAEVFFVGQEIERIEEERDQALYKLESLRRIFDAVEKRHPVRVAAVIARIRFDELKTFATATPFSMDGAS